MDEDMADLNGDDFWSSEIDFDYEFDVCRFFDFTRPESDADAYEAERWFHSAPSYPPSPFIVKLNLEKDFSAQVEKSSSPKVQGCDNLNSISNNPNVGNNHGISSSEMNTKGLKQPNRTKVTVKAETKCTVKTIKPRGSTLLKPTESHVAKQKKARDLNSIRKGRLQNPSSSTMNEKSLQKSPGYEFEATKRQKLDIGYLRKVAHLKHQNSMLLVKKVGELEGSSIYSRSRVTVPREPDLETAQRAQRRSFKSKNVPDSTQRARPNTHGFKARPLNRKILQAPSLPLPKKSMPPVPEFQVFHLKTTERALQHQSANILKAHNRNSALQRVHLSKACYLDKIFPSIEDESLIQNRLPPTELFNKLSLRSDSEIKTKHHRSTKGSKENVPTSFQPESWRCWGKLRPTQY